MQLGLLYFDFLYLSVNMLDRNSVKDKKGGIEKAVT